ncbi:MAG: 50S ribosomal protein L27 [Candidatus Doudnabacteria bacterium]|nr:50S ribosomal protein L27 [Candidatus Doudnabacteria bacterium]
MAHTKAGGAAKRTVDVAGKRLGVKKFGGEYAKAGNIIIRQNGTNFHPGVGTMMGRDHTIFATADGFVGFRPMRGFKRNSKLVDVLPKVEETPKKEKTVAAKAETAEPKAAKKKPAAKKATK